MRLIGKLVSSLEKINLKTSAKITRDSWLLNQERCHLTFQMIDWQQEFSNQTDHYTALRGLWAPLKIALIINCRKYFGTTLSSPPPHSKLGTIATLLTHFLRPAA